jgi:hypothetical protein
LKSILVIYFFYQLYDSAAIMKKAGDLVKHLLHCIPGQSRGYFGFGPGSSNPPPSQDTFCPEDTANSFCWFLFKLCILVGWVMDWKSADFHNDRVIFGRVGGKNTLF